MGTCTQQCAHVGKCGCHGANLVEQLEAWAVNELLDAVKPKSNDHGQLDRYNASIDTLAEAFGEAISQRYVRVPV